MIYKVSVNKGERWERRQWREQRPERVAGIGGRRSCTVSKENTEDPNRTATEKGE